MKGLYGMADAAFGDVEAQARLLAKAGACCVQLRCKGWGRARIAATIEALDLPIPVLVNDHVGLGDGGHLGQDDGPWTGPGLWGRSTHTLRQIDAAVAEGASYVGFGPVFPTGTKVVGRAEVGLEGLRHAVGHSPIPVVAIGGITLDRLPQLQQTGVPAWAVISAIWGATDPLTAARAFSPGELRAAPRP